MKNTVSPLSLLLISSQSRQSVNKPRKSAGVRQPEQTGSNTKEEESSGDSKNWGCPRLYLKSVSNTRKVVVCMEAKEKKEEG